MVRINKSNRGIGKLLFKIALLVSLFYFVSKGFWDSISKQQRKNDELLKNAVVFQGTVVRMEISNSHRFWVIGLRITESTTVHFNNKLENGILFPYRIDNGIAELYCYIPNGLKVGDSISVDSEKKEIVFKLSNLDDSFMDKLRMIVESPDLDFVNDNSSLGVIN